MAIVPIASELSKKAFRDESKYDPLDIALELADDYQEKMEQNKA